MGKGNEVESQVSDDEKQEKFIRNTTYNNQTRVILSPFYIIQLIERLPIRVIVVTATNSHNKVVKKDKKIVRAVCYYCSTLFTLLGTCVDLLMTSLQRGRGYILRHSVLFGSSIQDFPGLSCFPPLGNLSELITRSRKCIFCHFTINIKFYFPQEKIMFQYSGNI